ncbi:3950_t:CDS:2, partial [Gigaspora margarita]
MNHFMDTIIIPDDDDKITGTSTVKAPQSVNEFAVNIIGDEPNSNLINKEMGSQDDFTLPDNIWSTNTEELQEPNTQ